MAKEKKLTLKLGAALDSSFNKTFGAVNQQMQKLKNVEKTLKGFEKSSAMTKKHAQSFQGASSKYTDISKKIQNFGDVTDKNSKKYNMLLARQSKARVSMEYYKSEMYKSAHATKIKAQELHKLGLKTKNYQEQLKSVDQQMKILRSKKMGMGVAQSHVGALKAKAGDFIKTLGRVAATATLAGVTAIGAFGATSANHYVTFEKQMKKVQAISKATDAEYKMLEATAMKLGATTSFTAQEAAAGMEKFALAGFKVKDIMDVMPGVLALTAASGEDLALVADIISDNMIPFNLTAKDTVRVADVLANTMSRTNVNVGMIGETLKYAASSAGTLGISIEEVSAAIGLMGDQAVKSGMAGTSLKSAFARLSQEKIQDKLKKTGIAIKDSKGNFLGLANVVQQFQNKTKNMGNTERLGFMMDIFGEQGYQAFNMLMTAQKDFNGQTLTGVQALRALTEENQRAAGTAKRMEAIMLGGAQGAIILLSSAWDTIKLIVGKNIFTEEVIKSISTLTEYISELAFVLGGVYNNTKANVFFKNLITVINEFKANFSEAVKPIKEAMKSIMPKQSDIIPMLKNLFEMITTNLKVIAPAIGVLIKLFGLAMKAVNFIGADNILAIIMIGLALSKASEEIKKIIKTIEIAGGIIKYIQSLLAVNPLILIVTALIFIGYYLAKNGGLWNNFKAIILSLWEMLKAFFKFVTGGLLYTLGAPIIYITSIWQGLMEGIKNWDSNLSLGQNLLNIFNTVIEKIKENFSGLFEWLTGGFPKVWEAIKNIPFVKKLFGIEGNSPTPEMVPDNPKDKGELLADLNNTTGGNIINNNSTASSSSNNTSAVNNIGVTVNIMGNATPEAASAIGDSVRNEVANEFDRREREQRRTKY